MYIINKLVILSFLCCLITSYSSAQEVVVKRRLPVKIEPMKYAVTFVTDDTCYLRINEGENNKIVQSKTIKLPLGNYRLLFESWETGKTIRERSFLLTMDSLRGGTYTYQVNFNKQD
jgi:hypothetical protein